MHAMISYSHPLGLLFGCLLVVQWLTMRIHERRANPRRLPLPPGPKGYPIIGNLLDIPLYKPWLVYSEWFKIYGDMIYLNVLGRRILVLANLEKTNELLEKRSKNYSDRPPLPMVNDLMGWDFTMPTMRYGPVWRRHHRVFHDHFNAGAVAKYRSVQVSGVRTFLRNIMEQSSENFVDLIRLAFASIITKVAYGITVKGWDDDYVVRAEEAVRGAGDAATPGRFLVDVFPIMKWIPNWFPGAGWKRKANYLANLNLEIANEPYEFVMQQTKEGKAVPSICSQLIERLPEEGSPSRADEEAIARGVCAVAYLGGSDTSVSTVETFFLAMCIYPEIQRKAQAELDAVVQGRFPEFSDRPFLPYIGAVVKETLRWYPVTPFAFGHSAIDADEYNGYYIPKGTFVMGSVWEILHDPKDFRRPEEYNPERYLKDGKLDPTVRDPAVAAFGFGRRICPGRYFSDEALFCIIAHTLTVYDIKPGLDERGNEVKIQPEYTSAMVSHPVAFPCRIVPRSKAAEELVRNFEFAEY